MKKHSAQHLRRIRPNRPARTFFSRALPVGSALVIGALAVAALLAAGRNPTLSDGQASFPRELAPRSAANFNVLIITLDTTRADRLGCYGYAGAHTPALDRLASEGVRFGDAVAHTPITLPSHASIFTGLTPPSHGVRINGSHRLDPSQQTLAEVLKSRGYATAAFVSFFVLDARFGLNQGFDHYDDAIGAPRSVQFEMQNKRPARDVTDAAIRWLEQRDRRKPFFAWVHYIDPHEPYAPPQPFADAFRDRPYDGEIAYMDSQIGRLLDTLKRDGLDRNTLIVAVGDHGESLGAHQEPTHSLFIYEATQHVPLILSCPGLFRGPYVVDDVVVAISDIFPTVMDLLGIDHQRPCDGVSLLHARDVEGRMVYMEATPPYYEHGWAPLYALRRHTDKFISAPRPEYYDLRVDRDERHNEFAEAKGVRRASIAALKAALDHRLEGAPGLDNSSTSASGKDLEVIRRLEALGYVSSVSPDGSSGQLDPKDMIHTWVMLREAKELTEQGRLDQALEKVRQAQRRSPNDRSVFQRLGDIYSLQGRFDLAEEAYRSFNDILPTADSCVMLAQMVMAQQRPEEAEQILQQAVGLDAAHGGIYIVRGDILAMRGRADDAIDEYERAARVDPYRASSMAQFRINFIRSQQMRPSP